ncbi:MAG TPA: protein-methionine-sulfoxide reductase catalytic subunit MsrP [Aestuariivirga sp.]|nr:protein-methionine-sulfoxide reductase catalytic subunit MsrP [Aestuariivirga sp.]
MFIIRRKGWEISDSKVTPENTFFNRRQFLGAAAGAATLLGGRAFAEGDPSANLYPAKLNQKFADAGRPMTKEADNVNFNNYYEFGTSKNIASAAEALPIRPWTIAIDGEVEKPMRLSIDDLLKQVMLEERIYRHRCVEAWSMVVPWTGFPLSKIIELAKPTANAKYLRFETFNNPEIASGQQPGLFGAYPWPYVEGLTMAEATNDLAFMVTGAYGKPVAKSMGAPLRLHLPWKYGFKSIKAIVKVSFVAERPVGMWEQLASSEYGFWANVNPEVSHPRWSQASEQVLGSGERVPTQLFNGYGEFVASLYAGLDNEKLYM